MSLREFATSVSSIREYISERSRKNMLASQVFAWIREQPESRLSGVSNPRGGCGQAGQVLQALLGYLLVPSWGPSVKSRGEGRVFCTDTSSKLDFAFSVLKKLDVDCVGGYFTHLLNLV